MKNLFLCDFGDVRPTAELARARGLGLETLAFHRPERVVPSALDAHRADVAGVSPLSLHGPFTDLAPASPDPGVRRVARERYDEALEVARALRAGHVVFHLNFLPDLGEYRPGVVRLYWPRGWLEANAAFWRDFLAAHPGPTRFHVENLLDRDPEVLAALVEAVGDARLDACLDVGHAHVASEVPLTEWIRHLGKRLGHVHLHDNRGGSDEHLPLGAGTIPLAEVCAALEEFAPDASWAIEVRTVEGLKRSLEWLEANGFPARPRP